MGESDDWTEEEEHRPPDPVQAVATDELIRFFEAHKAEVFFSRQLEVRLEGKYFHWITNRCLRELRASGVIRSETRDLRTGGQITLLWHRSFRYYKRPAKGLVELVEEYADPNIGGALGLHGEALVLEGFAREQFVMRGRHTREHDGVSWTKTDHNLDFIFSRDGRSYGVEVKNTLGYMNDREFKAKTDMCEELGLTPVFAVRMMPKTWIRELVDRGGFALILKYQLYPWSHRELAKRVATTLGLPVDAPRAVESGTMARFLRWHEKHL